MNKKVTKILENNFVTELAIFFTFFFIIVVSCYVFFGNSNLDKDKNSVSELNSGWIINENENNSLDDSIELINENKTIVLERTVGDDLAGKTLAFYTSHMEVNITIDGDEIYNLYNLNNHFIHTAGTSYNFIDIPASAYSKDLKITLTKCYDFEYNEGLNSMLVINIQ